MLPDQTCVGLEHSSNIFLLEFQAGNWAETHLLPDPPIYQEDSVVCLPPSPGHTRSPHGGEAFSERSMPFSLLWFSLSFCSQRRKVFLSVLCRREAFLRHIPFTVYLVVPNQAWIMILRGQLAISTKTLSFHYVALAITQDVFATVSLTKVNFESQGWTKISFSGPSTFFPRGQSRCMVWWGKIVGVKGKAETHQSLKSSPCCGEKILMRFHRIHC